MRIKHGDVVVRLIEGMEFEARVIEIDKENHTVTLSYLDDDNIEKDVGFDEIQEIVEGKSDRVNSTAKNCRKGETLAKPLYGLVEDDYETRRNHIPKVILHENVDEDDAKAPIILNGAENRLAAGGGLRALRYLKK